MNATWICYCLSSSRYGGYLRIYWTSTYGQPKSVKNQTLTERYTEPRTWTDLSNDLGNKKWMRDSERGMLGFFRSGPLKAQNILSSPVLCKSLKFMHLEATLTNQNCIREKIKIRLNSGNARYHSVQSILFPVSPVKRKD